MKELLIPGLIFGVSFYIIWSVIKWRKSVLHIRKLNDRKIKEFKNLRITSFSYNGESIGSKISMGIYPIKSQIIFTENELYFLPQNYSLFLGMSEIPRSFNKNLDSNSNKRILKKELLIKFENKEIRFKRKIIEISLTGNQLKIDEFENYLNDWLGIK